MSRRKAAFSCLGLKNKSGPLSAGLVEFGLLKHGDELIDHPDNLVLVILGVCKMDDYLDIASVVVTP